MQELFHLEEENKKNRPLFVFHTYLNEWINRSFDSNEWTEKIDSFGIIRIALLSSILRIKMPSLSILDFEIFNHFIF